MNHLRLDVANTDVLGRPTPDSGTAASIATQLADGVIFYTYPPADVIKAALIHVSAESKKRMPDLGLTDFAVILMYRSTGRPGVRVFRNGNLEPIPPPQPAGELSWQLDAGGFRDDPVVGAVWFQTDGWSCLPEHVTPAEPLCGLVGAEDLAAEILN